MTAAFSSNSSNPLFQALGVLSLKVVDSGVCLCVYTYARARVCVHVRVCACTRAMLQLHEAHHVHVYTLLQAVACLLMRQQRRAR